MSTEKQKEAARRNIEKAREVQSERAHGEQIPRSSACDARNPGSSGPGGIASV
jgi:hypothetical protein